MCVNIATKIMIIFAYNIIVTIKTLFVYKYLNNFSMHLNRNNLNNIKLIKLPM